MKPRVRGIHREGETISVLIDGGGVIMEVQRCFNPDTREYSPARGYAAYSKSCLPDDLEESAACLLFAADIARRLDAGEVPEEGEVWNG